MLLCEDLSDDPKPVMVESSHVRPTLPVGQHQESEIHHMKFSGSAEAILWLVEAVCSHHRLQNSPRCDWSKALVTIGALWTPKSM